MTVLLVALAGGLGAAARFVTDSLLARRDPFRVPLGTMVINISGSLLLGLLTGLLATGSPGTAGATVETVLGTGFCGGYTTFSTASVEAARLWVAEGSGTGIRYAAVTLVASVAAAALGLAIGQAIAGMEST